MFLTWHTRMQVMNCTEVRRAQSKAEKSMEVGWARKSPASRAHLLSSSLITLPVPTPTTGPSFTQKKAKLPAALSLGTGCSFCLEYSSPLRLINSKLYFHLHFKCLIPREVFPGPFLYPTEGNTTITFSHSTLVFCPFLFKKYLFIWLNQVLVVEQGIF